MKFSAAKLSTSGLSSQFGALMWMSDHPRIMFSSLENKNRKK